MVAHRIDANLVAAGVGLPPMWMDSSGMVWTLGEIEKGTRPDCSLDLNDHQTRAGLLRQLAIWVGYRPFGCEHRLIRMLRGDLPDLIELVAHYPFTATFVDVGCPMGAPGRKYFVIPGIEKAKGAGNIAALGLILETIGRNPLKNWNPKDVTDD